MNGRVYSSLNLDTILISGVIDNLTNIYDARTGTQAQATQCLNFRLVTEQ